MKGKLIAIVVTTVAIIGLSGVMAGSSYIEWHGNGNSLIDIWSSAWHVNDYLHSEGATIDGWMNFSTNGNSSYITRWAEFTDGEAWFDTLYLSQSWSDDVHLWGGIEANGFGYLDQQDKVWTTPESIWGPIGLRFTTSGGGGYTKTYGEDGFEMWLGVERDLTNHDASIYVYMEGDEIGGFQVGNLYGGSGSSCKPVELGNCYYPSYDEWGLTGFCEGKGMFHADQYEDVAVWGSPYLHNEGFFNVDDDFYHVYTWIDGTGSFYEEFNWEDDFDFYNFFASH